MGHSKNTIGYVHIQLMVDSMESLLTTEQTRRILKAAEWGGFDAGMTSLARVSDQIAAAHQEAAEKAAYNEGRIISLEAEVKTLNERVEDIRDRLINVSRRMRTAETAAAPEPVLTVPEEKFLTGISHWGYLIVYSSDVPRNEMVNRLEAQDRVLVDRSEGTYLTVTLPVSRAEE